MAFSFVQSILSKIKLNDFIKTQLKQTKWQTFKFWNGKPKVKHSK